MKKKILFIYYYYYYYCFSIIEIISDFAKLIFKIISIINLLV